jgi:large subunit ribosomal protein L21
MYAIVEIAGQQFKVEEGKTIYVHRLENAEGDQVEFDKVLLIEDDGKITIGEPTINDFIVEGTVLRHMRGDKVIVFKKKRKKGYRIRNGHRQNLTQLEIISIGSKDAPRKAVTRKAKPVTEAATVTDEAAAVAEAPVKKPAAKKAASRKEEKPEKQEEKKKAAVKKPAAKKPSKGKEK